jgi:hypothetical protein
MLATWKAGAGFTRKRFDAVGFHLTRSSSAHGFHLRNFGRKPSWVRDQPSPD